MSPTEVIHTETRLRENRVLMLRAESFAPVDYVKNVMISFKESVSGLKNYMLLLQGFKGEDKTISSIRSTINSAKDLEGFNYVSHTDLLLPCPTGFKGDFLGYAMVLNENIGQVVQEVIREISNFNTELSGFISNKSAKISLRDNGNTIKAMQKWRKDKIALTGAFFTNGDNQRLKLEKMFDNAAGIVNASNQALLAYEKAHAADPRDVQSAVGQLVSKIENLIEMGESDSDVEISKEAALNLAEKCYEIGRLVELLAVYSAQCETAAVLASSMLERIIPLTK